MLSVDMVFHKKGCAHGLTLKVRGFGTQKWLICFLNLRVLLQVISKLFKLGSFIAFKKQVPIQGPILRVYSLHKYRCFQIPIQKESLGPKVCPSRLSRATLMK